MVWKLTRFELKKILGNRFFAVALCLLLILNLLLFGGVREYMNLQTAIRDGTLLEGVIAPEDQAFFRFMAVSRKATSRLRDEYRVLSDLSPEEWTDFEKAMSERYGDDILSNMALVPTEQMLTTPGYFGDKQSDFVSILDYQTLTAENQALDESLSSVLRAAKSFSDRAENRYEIQRNQNILQLYTLPRKPITSPIRGWQEFLFGTTPMVLVYLLVLLASAGSFAGEQDKGMWMILHTAKCGKGKTLVAKYLAGSIIAAAVTVLFQIATLGAIWFKGGLLGANQPIAAVSELKLCPYPLVVWQYALLFLACQIVTAVILSVLLSTVSALCKSGMIAYAAGTVLLGGTMLLVVFPPKAELLIGPLALSRPLRYFNSYFTGNIFGRPVLWAVIHILLWLAFCAGAMVLAHKVYHRKRRAV